ncbi:hypothetical protein MY3296_001682 [Beauveria thailandica]
MIAPFGEEVLKPPQIFITRGRSSGQSKISLILRSNSQIRRRSRFSVKPCVKFREYWRLVKDQPDDPAETYHCTYLPRWINTSARAFRGNVANPSLLFEETIRVWTKSESCQLLKSRLQQTASIHAVKKIICFGLGDICRTPPEWMKRQAGKDAQNLETEFVRGAMIQHSIALTVRQICNDLAGCHIQLLAQDPDYTKEAKEILASSGFSIVGEFGAGGFAEIDDESLVFSVYVEAPLKQIIADIARPPIIISTGFDVFNDSEKPWIDAESPRTMVMWREYNEKASLPIAQGDEEVMSKMRDIYIYAKKDSQSL